MYKFIQYLYHKNTTYSHVAYLYQDTTTKKYYLSYTTPDNEDVIDNTNIYMLLNNGTKRIQAELLKNIDIVAEVTQSHFIAGQINDYII
jgi:hypothetical protein